MPKGSLYSGRLRSAESLVYMSFDAALFFLVWTVACGTPAGGLMAFCMLAERERDPETSKLIFKP